MAGGLLNIVASGQGNLFLTGNPSKTFFKVTYSKYTNFGLQKFRLDYDGIRDIRATEDSVFTFKVKRYGDLFMDTYLVLTLPDIYSPIFSPCPATNNRWSPYEFRWIRHLGTQIVRHVEIFCGSQKLQSYSGHYMEALVDRDFGADKKGLFDRMTGNVPELFDPATADGRQGAYPSVFGGGGSGGGGGSVSTQQQEPSIRGRKLYIPINAWFTLSSKCAFPLIATPFTDVSVVVTLRPIRDLFQIRDVLNVADNFPYVQPNFGQEYQKMYYFLQTPPANVTVAGASIYPSTLATWNADIHLISTYAFLSDDERKSFASQAQVYLVKDVFQYDTLNIVGTKKVELRSNGMVSNWMIYFQRNDVNMRNEWSNYSNWPYALSKPDNVQFPSMVDPSNTPALNPDGSNTGIVVTGVYSPYNEKQILQTMAVVLDGKYRENVLDAGVFAYVEKYTRTAGAGSDDLYCYNFCMDTSPFVYQPSGAINLAKFSKIELEVVTLVPPLSSTGVNTDVVCINGQEVAVVNNPSWMMYEYGFNMMVFEERYNVLSFIGGECGFQFSR